MHVDGCPTDQTVFHLQVRRDDLCHAAGFGNDFRTNPVAREQEERLLHVLTYLLRNTTGAALLPQSRHVTHGF
jgi:hypothetical protein